MKRFIFIVSFVVFICACRTTPAVFFTGTIEYSYTYTSDSLNADSLTKERTAKSFFRYDTLNYQSRFEGKDTQVYFYSGKRNKALAVTGQPAEYSCEDYSAITDSVVGVKIYDTEDKVLGFPCRVLEIQKKNSWVRYHVSKDLRIAPGTYRNHVSYNWDVYGREAGGGLILKSEHRFKQFSMHGKTIKLMRFSDPEFRALEVKEELFDQYCN
jgi:hypothetical protein